MSKIRTLLFGAGKAALQFIHTQSENRIFVGVLDNNSDKIGTSLEGLPILRPDDCYNLQFDELVITTQWSVDVYEQVTKELCVPSSKVIVPPKNLFKGSRPFETAEMRQFAKTLIHEVFKSAEMTQAELVLDFGTLLGIIRDGDIIPWDDDIDFSADIKYRNQILKTLINFVETTSLQNVSWKISELSSKNEVVGYLLKFTPSSASSLIPFTSSFSIRKIEDDLSVHKPSLGMFYAPRCHFDQAEKLIWKQEAVYIPYLAKKYLKFVYGDDWTAPKKDTDYSSYSNIKRNSFEDMKDYIVIENELESAIKTP